MSAAHSSRSQTSLQPLTSRELESQALMCERDLRHMQERVQREPQILSQSSRELRGDMLREAVFLADLAAEEESASIVPSLQGLRTSREHQSLGDISREAAVSRRSAHEDAVSVAESSRAPRVSPTQSARELQSPVRTERLPREPTREERMTAAVRNLRMPQSSRSLASNELRSSLTMRSEHQSSGDIWKQSVFDCHPAHEEGAADFVSAREARMLMQASREPKPRGDDFWSTAVVCGELAHEEDGVDSDLVAGVPLTTREVRSLVQSSRTSKPQEDDFWSQAVVAGSLAMRKDVSDCVGALQSVRDGDERLPMSAHRQPVESPAEVFVDSISEVNGLDARSYQSAARSCSPVLMTPREVGEPSITSRSSLGHSTSRKELEDLRNRNVRNYLERSGQRSVRHAQRSARQAREAVESRILDSVDSAAACQAWAQIVDSRASPTGNVSTRTSISAREEAERSQEVDASLQIQCPTIHSEREAALSSPSICSERAERPPPHGEETAEEADKSCDAEQELLALWRGASDSRKDELLALCRGVVSTTPPEPQPERLPRAKSASRANFGSAEHQLRNYWRSVERTELDRLWGRRLGR